MAREREGDREHAHGRGVAGRDDLAVGLERDREPEVTPSAEIRCDEAAGAEARIEVAGRCLGGRGQGGDEDEREDEESFSHGREVLARL
jgi:hypothetical protein